MESLPTAFSMTVRRRVNISNLNKHARSQNHVCQKHHQRATLAIAARHCLLPNLHRPACQHHLVEGVGNRRINKKKSSVSHYTKARFVAWLGHLPQEAQAIWLPNNDLAVPEDWQQSGLLQLTKAHAELISKYRCQEGPAPAASQDPADARARQGSPARGYAATSSATFQPP